MDGFSHDLIDWAPAFWQRSLRRSIPCSGIGLHSGQRVSMVLHPAPADHGIVFRRTDLGIEIPARFDLVSDTRLCTLVSHPDHPQARVGTIEHLMAALAACGVDNALVELDGPEVPIMDGSASPFVFLIDCVGTVEQDAPARAIEVLRTIRVEDGESFAELRPMMVGGLEMAVSIRFDAAAIGRQAFSMRLGDASFRRHLARARTFAMAADIAGLQAAGLARGGSLDNAVVVDGGTVLNPSGLRMADEFVCHKMLDAVGDLALAGAPLHARFVAHRPGHALNNRLLRALMADPTAWTWAAQPASGHWSATGVGAEAVAA